MKLNFGRPKTINTEKTMSEPKTIQDVVMTSIQAEDAGVVVDWKQTCLQIVNAAQQEFARITAEQGDANDPEDL